MDQFLNFIAWGCFLYGSILTVTRVCSCLYVGHKYGEKAAGHNFGIIPHLIAGVVGGAWLYYC